MLISKPGRPADSRFRLTKLEKRLEKQGFTGVRLASYWVHWIKAEFEQNEVESQLEQLLDYGEGDIFDLNQLDPLLILAPRLGTLSPWSSKANAAVARLGIDVRIERGKIFHITQDAHHIVLSGSQRKALKEALKAEVFDPLMHADLDDWQNPEALFYHATPRSYETIPVLAEGKKALEAANTHLGMALSDDEIEYLLQGYLGLERDPTDAELMMFAQANSEHCRHKIFNADWVIDGRVLSQSLFDMIRNTTNQSPEGVWSAYSDNAAVIHGPEGHRFFPDKHGTYGFNCEQIPMLMKVETHNHPTAIAPHPGAATGAGGEIRDEGATGRGSKPKVGLVGFHVSHLQIPSYTHPWEQSIGRPERIASALQIMLDGPIGAASYNNEFGRPNLCGYFRSFEFTHNAHQGWGYHKPVMIAGGYGNIRPNHVNKADVPVGAKIIVLGPPALLIGFGGGSASSVAGGAGDGLLDIASVQRDNPESERRCQEVIDRCWQLGDENPILFIHDVGAGGLSNALPELVKDANRGGVFELRTILIDEPGMAPMEIWCNESQERYVIAVAEDDLQKFEAICAREVCPFAVVGTVVAEKRVTVSDHHFNNRPVDLPQSILFGKPPKITMTVSKRLSQHAPLVVPASSLTDALTRVLKHPAVASKKFLITIGDRSVTGTVTRDQFVGPWQEPVADCAVTTVDFIGYSGEAMAMGERPPLALISPAASTRMAVTEALTNIMAAPIGKLGKVKLSANWMASARDNDQALALHEGVNAIGNEFCPALGIAIPVGKDSLSMETRWDGQKITAPLTCVISAFAPVSDVRQVWTPLLERDARRAGPLYLIDLGAGQHRLGGSILAQVYEQIGETCPDMDGIAGVERLKAFWNALQSLHGQNVVQAYHDRSDGGLLVTLLEMAFASRCGLNVDVTGLMPESNGDLASALAVLFAEEAGAVVQVASGQESTFLAAMVAHGLEDCAHLVGRVHQSQRIQVIAGEQSLSQKPLAYWLRLWAETSYRMQALRDNPACAQQEFDMLLNDKDPGLSPKVEFTVERPVVNSRIARPKVAILREQGVNGHVEMAAAFDRAGFEAVDVHMTDLIESRHSLKQFNGLVACGGFSFGDVLGAGRGWAKNILMSPLAEPFQHFFEDRDRFALGVCNGCQMLSQLKSIIPGARHWPQFQRNLSEQFEARLNVVKVRESNSLFLRGMAGSQLLISSAHGEGRAVFPDQFAMNRALESNVCLQYVDHHGHITEQYPMNPNGSLQGITGLCNDDGRVMLMMPHPERLFRQVLHSWSPYRDEDDGPWMQLFYNAFTWLQ